MTSRLAFLAALLPLALVLACTDANKLPAEGGIAPQSQPTTQLR